MCLNSPPPLEGVTEVGCSDSRIHTCPGQPPDPDDPTHFGRGDSPPWNRSHCPAVRAPGVPGWRGHISVGPAEAFSCSRLTRQLPGCLRFNSVSAQAPASLVPCPVPTLIPPCRGHTGAKHKRFCSPEGKLGEEGQGAQKGAGYVRGEVS